MASFSSAELISSGRLVDGFAENVKAVISD
jgi:hypothetical protein